MLDYSTRTIIRWKHKTDNVVSKSKTREKVTRHRSRHYDPAIFARIEALKVEHPEFTAPIIERKIKNEFHGSIPSESTVRKYLLSKGYSFKKVWNRQGYVKFQRDSPNDMWQIDIAGGQYVKGLGVVYLIVLEDDCSRFIVAAQYFQDQKTRNVMQVIRDAIVTYGRPKEIFSDNGTQFKNTMSENNTQYLNLLISLDIKPGFARKRHPQSKGKIERIFSTVKQDFLVEFQASLSQLPEISMSVLNNQLQLWVKWYNEQKPHRSLPHRKPPTTIYWNAEKRIYRPLETQVDWNQWINNQDSRKVNKYNQISYQTQAIQLPQGYMGCWVEILHLEDRFEIYHLGQLVCTHMKMPEVYCKAQVPVIRTIAANGIFQYKRHWYTVDYKLAGKKVEIQESEEGRTLLVYLDTVLLKRLSAK